MALHHVINFGKQTSIQQHKPRKAIAECFRPNLESIAFQNASARIQEIFLFEYLQACQRAAKNELRAQYYAEAARVAKFYITWYPTRERQLPAELRRVNVATFQLGDAYAELLDWSTLLTEYDEIARSNRTYLRDERTLLNWYKALRTEGAIDQRTLGEVRARIREEPEHREDWKLFLETSRALRTQRRYRIDLRNAIHFAQGVIR